MAPYQEVLCGWLLLGGLCALVLLGFGIPRLHLKGQLSFVMAATFILWPNSSWVLSCSVTPSPASEFGIRYSIAYSRRGRRGPTSGALPQTLSGGEELALLGRRLSGRTVSFAQGRVDAGEALRPAVDEPRYCLSYAPSSRTQMLRKRTGLPWSWSWIGPVVSVPE